MSMQALGDLVGAAGARNRKRASRRHGGWAAVRWVAWVGGAALLALVCGCTAARQSDLHAEGPTGVFRPAGERDVSAQEYRVAPPDKLQIRAPGIKEMDNVVTTIRPDGKISVNMLREVYVANRTPEEIGRMLTEGASKYYNNVQVSVEVVEYASKFYEVFGTAVREPGRKPYTGRNTVIAALAGAGFNQEAWPEQVSVSRPARGGQARATAIVDMKTMYMTGDTRQNYLLEEGDIVYVPFSPLAAWDEKTRRILGPLTGTIGAAQQVTPTAGPR
jgi:polysaccharide export outer membrane protein